MNEMPQNSSRIDGFLSVAALWLFAGFLGLSVIALSLGFLLAGHWAWALLFCILGLVGWLARYPAFYFAPAGNILFAILVTASALGVIAGLSVPLMLAAVTFALGFWDLHALETRLRQAVSSPATATLEKAHLQRLLPILALGFLLALIPLSIQFELSLEWAMALGLLLVVGLRLGIHFLTVPQK
jgi:hypothetical protein